MRDGEDVCLGSWDRASFERDRVCLAGIVTSILDEDRVSSERPSPSIYVMMRTSIVAGATVVHTVHDFFISHRFDRTFDLYTVLLRRNRKEAHDAVSTMFLSCVRQYLICHRLFWDIPGLRIADTEQGPHADDGTRCFVVAYPWGAGSVQGLDRSRFGRPCARGSAESFHSRRHLSSRGDTDPPSRSARSLAQKSLSDGYAVRDDRARPSTPFSPMA